MGRMSQNMELVLGVCVYVLTLILSLDIMKDYRGKSLPLWPSDPGLTGPDKGT